MTLKLRSFLPVICLAAASLTAVAHADDFSGSVYQLTNDGTVVSTAGLTKLGTFTVDNINFQSQTAATYTVGQFLASGGTNLVISPTLAADSLGSTEMVITGKTTLVKGTTYTFTHDDGMTLSIDTLGLVINTPSPTVAEGSSFTYTGPTGDHTFTLMYGENSMAPAVLQGSFTPVPEPNSIVLLGSGLVGLAGAVRRKIKA